MRGKWRILAWLVVGQGILIFFCLAMPCLGATVSPGEGETVREVQTRLPEEETEGADFWASFWEVVPSLVKEEMDVEGDPTHSVGLEALLDGLVSGIRGEGRSLLSLLFQLLGLVVLGAVATLIGEETRASMQAGIRLAISAGAGLFVYQLLGGVIEDVNIYLQDILQFADGLAPVFGSVLLAGGGVSSATVGAANMAGWLLLMKHICVEALPPLAGACFGFSLLGSMSDGLQVGVIGQNVRGIYLTLLGVICTLATAGLRLQTVLAASKDTVAMQTARFAVGNMIPLVGNAVGATLGTLQSSLSVVKNSIGVSAVAVLFLMTVPILVRLVGVRFLLNLTGGVAKFMGFEGGAKLLTEFRGVIDLLLAVSGMVSVTMVLYIAIFLRVALPGVAV